MTIDLLTDSGATAMSTDRTDRTDRTDQWAAVEGVRATPATSDEHYRVVDAWQESLGYEYRTPTHQGRAVEHILSQITIKPGEYVPGNMYFTTAKLHQEFAGGIFVDVIVDDAHEPKSGHAWKGDIDIGKFRALVDEHGVEKIAYVSFEHSVNMAGGQAVARRWPGGGQAVASRWAWTT